MLRLDTWLVRPIVCISQYCARSPLYILVSLLQYWNRKGSHSGDIPILQIVNREWLNIWSLSWPILFQQKLKTRTVGQIKGHVITSIIFCDTEMTLTYCFLGYHSSKCNQRIGNCLLRPLENWGKFAIMQGQVDNWDKGVVGLSENKYIR